MSSRRGRGEGNIETLPSGKFRAVVSHGRDPATGKRRKLTETFDTKREALAWLRDRQTEASRGTLANAGSKTVAEWLTEWLEIKRSKIEPNSWHWYERRVRLHLIPTIGPLLLGKLQPLDIERMHATLSKSGTSASEQHKAATTLRASMKDAVKLRLIATNPALMVTKPKMRKKDMCCLNADQAKRFLAAARTERLAALFDLELDAGLRPGELYALHWTEVDLVAGNVAVAWSLEDIGGELRLKQPKTEKSRRRIIISPRTVESLKAHRERMMRERRDIESGLVFPDTHGGFLRVSNLRRDSFLKVVKRADLKPFRIYDLRHTVATLLLIAGVNIKVVSERLGHESIEITLKHYAHCLSGMQQVAADAVQSLFGDCPTGVPNGQRVKETKADVSD